MKLKRDLIPISAKCATHRKFEAGEPLRKWQNSFPYLNTGLLHFVEFEPAISYSGDH